MKAIIITTALILMGCTTPQPPMREIEISFPKDEYGIRACAIDGVPYKITEEERKQMIQDIVNANCPVI